MHYIGYSRIFASLLRKTVKCLTKKDDSVAQLVEHYTFNVVVLGSNPSGITKINLIFPVQAGFTLRGDKSSQTDR